MIKVFFENDQQRLNDLHDELLKNNEQLTKDLAELKEKARRQEAELIEVKGKYREANDKVKKLEREKQLDEMALVTLKMIKEESAKEILKLNSHLNTLKLDLLAEKQLRRIHQTTLHQLDPKNENYDSKSITIDDQPELPSNYSITPFWQLYSESSNSKNETVKKDHSYIVPSKIQKSNEKGVSTQSRISNRQKRSSSREDRHQQQGSSLVPLPEPSQKSNDSSQNKGFTFSFGNSSGFSSLFRFGGSSDTQDNSQPSTSHQQSNTTSFDQTSRFNSYRESRTNELDSPRTSER